MNIKQVLPLLFRLGAVVAIAWMIHRHHRMLAAEGDRPIGLTEVRAFLPEAVSLPFDAERDGRVVRDAAGERIGYAARTMPVAESVKGYSGPSDVLLVFDVAEALLGVSVRHSYDTPSHVEDVKKDYGFMEQWNGMSWAEIGALDGLDAAGLEAREIHGVSGATRTSEAVARGMAMRMAAEPAPPGFRFRWMDALLLGVAGLGCVLAFFPGAKWQRGERRRVGLQVLMVVALGVIAGDLLAQSLFMSWTQHGVPWRTLPGLVVLAAVALLVPWGTGKKVYCTHICPHGHLQRWLVKVMPAKWRLRLARDEKWSFKVFPALVLVAVLVVVMLRLPLDLAGFEPFDAWTLKGAGVATLTVAGVGLVYSLFVPMGYCAHACPTGFLLDLVRRERAGFVKRDGWLLALLVLVAGVHVGYEPIQAWMLGAEGR